MIGIDSDYQSLCQDLSLPEGVRKRAWAIWQDLDKLDETQVRAREGVRKRAWAIWQDLDKLDETQVRAREGVMKRAWAMWQDSDKLNETQVRGREGEEVEGLGNMPGLGQIG